MTIRQVPFLRYYTFRWLSHIISPIFGQNRIISFSLLSCIMPYSLIWYYLSKSLSSNLRVSALESKSIVLVQVLQNHRELPQNCITLSQNYHLSSITPQTLLFIIIIYQPCLLTFVLSLETSLNCFVLAQNIFKLFCKTSHNLKPGPATSGQAWWYLVPPHTLPLTCVIPSEASL